MKGLGNLIIKQSRLCIENKQIAILYAVLFSIIPFASWLSVSLIILISLRKGARAGFELMLPTLVIHSVPLMLLLPLKNALMNTALTYVPAYTAALCLRKTQSWALVFGLFLIQALLGFSIIQLWAPDFIVAQFTQLMQILNEYKDYHHLISDSFNLAQLLFGVQVLSIVASALISLLFARSIQAKLYMPGGFREECLQFRSGKIALLILMGVTTASYFECALAINVLPLILSYFFLSGFNLAYHFLVCKNQVRMIVLLVLIILFKPSFVLLAYVLLGALDSLVNFRLYLPIQAREST